MLLCIVRMRRGDGEKRIRLIDFHSCYDRLAHFSMSYMLFNRFPLVCWSLLLHRFTAFDFNAFVHLLEQTNIILLSELIELFWMQLNSIFVQCTTGCSTDDDGEPNFKTCRNLSKILFKRFIWNGYPVYHLWWWMKSRPFVSSFSETLLYNRI